MQQPCSGAEGEVFKLKHVVSASRAGLHLGMLLWDIQAACQRRYIYQACVKCGRPVSLFGMHLKPQTSTPCRTAFTAIAYASAIQRITGA